MLAKNKVRIWTFFAALVLLLFMSIPSTALAVSGSGMVNECFSDPNLCQDQTNTTDAEADSTESASLSMGPWEYIKILFSLIFVITLLVMLLRFLNKRNVNYQQNALVRNIGGLSVGPQKSVQLLQIGGSVYVVGVGDEVQLLKEVTDPEEIQQLLAYYNDKQGAASTKPYISELLGKFNTRKESHDVSDRSNFNTLFNDRIKEIKKERSEELERWKEQENDKR
ncbi:MAG: flagellar biosynthetic protein FliO [Solibacillus sp.]